MNLLPSFIVLFFHQIKLKINVFILIIERFFLIQCVKKLFYWFYCLFDKK
ncbi:hypothetical protein HMPREF3203_00211 [Proteus mirabilis]|nr:hypothetical protein HMPREF3203_00211 [Proteus mirabilis]